MAKDKLTQYSSTAGSNTEIGGISIAEGMLPSNVNNALREQMSHLADFAAGTSGVDVLKLQDDTDTNSIKIQAPASVTTTTTFTLPDGDGSANQSLVTNGSGTLSFSTRLANVVEDTTPQLGGDLDTNGNDINFGDNDKATFGDAVGGDLQIYHNSTDGNSFIDDAGTGALAIRGSQVNIAKYTGETMAQFVSDGAVNLFYNDSKKLATTSGGINVTGTVTASDSFEVSQGVASMPSNTGNAHIVRTEGSGTAPFNQAGSLLYLPRQSDTDGRSNHLFYTGATPKLRQNIKANGDISFYDSTGVSQGLFWDASTQRLGLGTTSPAQLLHVNSTGNVAAAQIQGASHTAKISTDGAGTIFGSTTNGYMLLTTNSAERARIDTSGNLLVGYTSSNGAYKLQVNSQIFATSATIATSDGNYKENITPLDGALSLVSQLNPVQFDWKEHPVHEFDRNQPTIGFIAQEVQQVLAEQPYLNSIVKSNECVLEAEETDDEGNVIKEAVTEPFLGIAEGNMVALLTAAIKEQQATITTLEARIAALESN